MSFWDSNKENFNIKFPTMGGEYFWNDIESGGGYRIQQNKLNPSHCRILDTEDERVAWGNEGAMRAKFRELTRVKGAIYGDVIGVHRAGGLYDHYGVFENNNCIYEYNGDTTLDCSIRITTLDEFTNYTRNYFVLEFPASYCKPGKVEFSHSAHLGLNFPGNLITGILKSAEYHLYSPEETIRRAKSRLGESKYNLIFSNCEHFAIWCKTGIRESHQIDSLIGILSYRSENGH